MLQNQCVCRAEATKPTVFEPFRTVRRRFALYRIAGDQTLLSTCVQQQSYPESQTCTLRNFVLSFLNLAVEIPWAFLCTFRACVCLSLKGTGRRGSESMPQFRLTARFGFCFDTSWVRVKKDSIPASQVATIASQKPERLWFSPLFLPSRSC